MTLLVGVDGGGTGCRVAVADLSGHILAQATQSILDCTAPASDYLCGLLDRLGGPEGAVAFSFSASPGDFATFAPEIIASQDPACRALWTVSTSDVRQVLCALQADFALPVTFTGGLGPATASALPDIAQRPAFGSARDSALSLARQAA
jgi:glucosamine kinase